MKNTQIKGETEDNISTLNINLLFQNLSLIKYRFFQSLFSYFPLSSFSFFLHNFFERLYLFIRGGGDGMGQEADSLLSTKPYAMRG